MNPNPFASLNHFTVPVTIYPLLSMLWGGTLPPCPHDERSRESNTYCAKTHPEPTPARLGSGRAAADIGGFRKQNSRSSASFLPSTTYYHGAREWPSISASGRAVPSSTRPPCPACMVPAISAPS